MGCFASRIEYNTVWWCEAERRKIPLYLLLFPVLFPTFLLREWLGIHPDATNPAAPVGVYLDGPRKGQMLSYDSIRLGLQSIARETGCRKRVTPHTFRHITITTTCTRLTEPVRYIHLSLRDVDDEVLAMHGILREAKKEKILNPRRCRRCELMNSAEARFCRNQSRCLLRNRRSHHRFNYLRNRDSSCGLDVSECVLVEMIQCLRHCFEERST